MRKIKHNYYGIFEPPTKVGNLWTGYITKQEPFSPDHERLDEPELVIYKTYADKSYDELCSTLRRELEKLNRGKVK